MHGSYGIAFTQSLPLHFLLCSSLTQSPPLSLCLAPCPSAFSIEGSWGTAGMLRAAVDPACQRRDASWPSRFSAGEPAWLPFPVEMAAAAELVAVVAAAAA